MNRLTMDRLAALFPSAVSCPVSVIVITDGFVNLEPLASSDTPWLLSVSLVDTFRNQLACKLVGHLEINFVAMMLLGILVAFGIVNSYCRKIPTDGFFGQAQPRRSRLRRGFYFECPLTVMSFSAEMDISRTLDVCTCTHSASGLGQTSKDTILGMFKRDLAIFLDRFRNLFIFQKWTQPMPLRSIFMKLRHFQLFFIAVAIMARIPMASAIAQGEDFSSNLFSDLGPILALFGDQVAKQFMAGSLGWADNIIFAMVPLGIITAITGAIRIGGPGWLKAIVGRARENRPSAEVELTTSTSDEVCELYNGNGIVRMIGSPKVLELLYFPTKVDGRNYQLHTVITAFHDKKINPEPLTHWGSSILSQKHYEKAQATSATSASKTDEENPLSRSEHLLAVKESSVPNISLNLVQRNRGELYGFAIFGVVLQVAVFIFPGFTVYNKRLENWIDGEESLSYGYPLAVTGTFILVIGMLICAFIVEASTTETLWSLKDDPPKSTFRMLWLQQGEKVNDQAFGSYVIFGQRECRSVITSTMTTKVEAAKINAAAKRGVSHTCRSSEPSSKGIVGKIRISTESFVIFGTIAGVSGFIVQFTGIRSIHWSASIALLVATLIMAGVRAFVRRGMGSQPHTYQIPKGHELDWLATRIATEDDRLFSTRRDDKTPPNLGNKNQGGWSRFIALFSHTREEPPAEDTSDDAYGFWSEGCWKWTVTPASDMSNFRFHQDTDLPESFRQDQSRFGKVVRIRQRLGLLSRWTTEVSDTAAALATAIEAVMNELFPNGSVKESEGSNWWWPLRDTADNPIHLSVKCTKGKWTANVTEIEAVLSLWIYSAQTLQKKREDLQDTPTSSSDNFKINSEVSDDEPHRRSSALHDWLRNGTELQRPTNLRLLAADDEILLRDIHWYFDKGLPQLKKTRIQYPTNEPDRDAPPRSPDLRSTSDATDTIVNVYRNRIIGLPSSLEIPQPGPPTLRFCLQDIDSIWRPTEESGPPKTQNTHFLGTTSDVAIGFLYAQEVFSAFMWAAAEKMEPLGGATTLHEADQTSNWQSFTIQNSTLTKILNEIERVADRCFGNMLDVYFSIAVPLSYHKKFPDASCVVEHASKVANAYEVAGRWKAATDTFLWLFWVCKGLPQEFQVRSTAILLGFGKAIEAAEKVSKDQIRDPGELKSLQKAASIVQTVLKTGEQKVVADLKSMLGSFPFFLESNPNKFTEGKLRNPWEKSQLLRNLNGNSKLHFTVIQTEQNNRILEEEIDESLIKERNLIGQTPLHFSAILNRDRWSGKFLQMDLNNHQSQKFPESEVDSLGRSPIHYAAALGHKAILHYLFDESTTHNGVVIPDISGMTPLHYVSDKDTAWQLLQHGARIETQDRNGFSALHTAAMRGIIHIVELFVESGANIDSLDNLRQTPLHWAAYRGHEDVVNFLVRKGASIAARDNYGRNSILLAAIAGKMPELLTRYIKENDEIGVSDRAGLTALHLAASNGRALTVRTLVQDYKANVEANDRSGRTPLHQAASNGHESTVRTLVELNAHVEAKDNEGWTPLRYAAWNGHELTVRTLVELNADIEVKDKCGRTPLHLAAWNGHESTVRALVKLKANLEVKDKYRQTPLHRAALIGHESTVRALVELSARAEAKDKYKLTPLHLATLNGHELAVRTLVELKANVEAKDNNGQTPLRQAAWNGHDSIVRALIELNANTEAKDKHGQTPLHRAALTGHKSTVCALVELKAYVEAKDNDGRTPLHQAVLHGLESTVRIMVELKADIEAKDNDGQTPLHLAALNGLESTVRVLVELKANIKAKDKHGQTPLHKAALIGHESTVHALIEHNADIQAKDNDGQTPLNMAAVMASVFPSSARRIFS